MPPKSSDAVPAPARVDEADPTGPVTDPISRTGDTVTVCCKLPHGLELRVFRMDERNEPVMGGGFRAVPFSVQMGDSITIVGNSHPQNEAPANQIVGGYGITYGVPADFWALWREQNKDAPYVRNGLVWAHASTPQAIDFARENAARKSGLERIDPNNLPKGLEKASVAA